jgi:hypothetical protein
MTGSFIPHSAPKFCRIRMRAVREMMCAVTRGGHVSRRFISDGGKASHVRLVWIGPVGRRR